MEIVCSICCCSFLDPKTETQLPFTRSSPSNSGNGSNTVYSSFCGHVFHKYCILKWLQKSESCPECRAEIRGKGDFHKIFFSVNPKSDDESETACEADDGEKIVMQQRTEKLTKYIKCVTKELGHVELKFDKLKQDIAKKDQEIAELRNLLNMERLLIPLRRQTLK